MRSKKTDNYRNKKKQKKSDLEGLIFTMIEKGLKKAMKTAMDDIFKEWK